MLAQVIAKFSEIFFETQYCIHGGPKCRHTIFTARRNARIASAVLAIQQFRLSVRLSVTRRYCVKTTARKTVQFALLDSKMCVVL